jgi:hypothetical protein
MRQDGLNQIARTTIMQEKDALAQTPQRSRTKLIRPGGTLRYAIRQAGTHVVHSQIREEIDRLPIQSSRRR